MNGVQLRWAWGRGIAAATICLLAYGCGGGGAKDDELDDLVLAGAVLVPEFEHDVYDYTAEVANDVASITVTPTAEDAAATVTVNGVAVASGAASPPIDLAVGDTTISIQVSAEDGDRETYTVVVTRRPVPSSNPALASFSLTAAELDQLFDPDITAYTASVGHLGASTRVVAVPEDEGTLLELAGATVPAGAESPYVALPVGTSTVSLLATSEDGAATRAYEVDVDRAGRASLQQRAYVKASNTGPDAFGASLTLSGETLVVGAPEEGSAASGVGGDESDNSLVDAGAAYVFERTGSGWVQTAYLKASSPGDPDRFGDSTALDGDRLLVGAPGEQSLATGIDGDDDDDSASFVGAAYVFERDAMGFWSRMAYLKASNAGQGDQFGRALDLAGRRAVVGAWSEDGSGAGVDADGSSNGLPGSGAAYVFSVDDQGSWREEAYLKASNPDAGDEFGRAVSVSADTVAVGARFEDSAATGIDGDQASDSLTSAGAVYLFDLDDDGEWVQSAYLKASNTDAGDRFGASLDLDGDLLAVGAPAEDSGADGVGGDEADDTLDGAGAVYVFRRDGDGAWSQIAYVKASNPGSGDGFGSAVALRGNVLVVAGRGENSAASGLDGDELDDSAPNSGAVYVLELTDGGDWQQVGYVKASNADAGDEFGSAVAFDGDTLAVGAELEDSADTGVNGDESDDSQSDAGAVYVIR